MASTLTTEMILKRAKVYNLEEVRKINFWGHSLYDISTMSNCKYLQSASFSQNLIKSLKCFQGMKYLEELSMAKNNIRDIREVCYLSSCINLRILWLKENPICEISDYRQYVIRMIPQLRKLDDIEIDERERQIVNCDQYIQDEQNAMKMQVNYNNNNLANGLIQRRGSTPIQSSIKNNLGNHGYYKNKNDDNKKYNVDDKNKRERGRTPNLEQRNYLPENRYAGNNYGYYNKNFYMQDGSGKNNEYNNYNYDYMNMDRGLYERCNSNNIYNRGSYGRPIPNSAESHVRNYGKGDRNPMEISSMAQQGIVNCISTLLKKLNTDELLYIKEHIDRKISKY